MSSSGSPCGACKFLRRKCVKGCVFAPYFSYEQGPAHFSAIHKVFGASNVSKLLSHLPIDDRCEAAMTIAYEAQARVHDPIYGCVSHIFALQQQVMYLQAQLASLEEKAAQCIIINSSKTTENPNNHNFQGESNFFPQDVQSWLQNQVTNMPPFDANRKNVENSPYFSDYGTVNLNPNSTKYENPGFREEEKSFISMDSRCEMQFNQDDADDLQSVAFGYIQHS